jgi:hypothetical protein
MDNNAKVRPMIMNTTSFNFFLKMLHSFKKKQLDIKLTPRMMTNEEFQQTSVVSHTTYFRVKHLFL